ncbi:MAG: glycosyltransferase family 4 protein [Desulfobacterales bacterium]|nr:glycosyltransferase family 4 protein [Desulfobacterales bacterium]
MGLNIGFVSTRLAGTDGVSLEASKWADVLEKSGHPCFWFAGQLDRPASQCFPVPQAHFQHEQNLAINAGILGKKRRTPEVTRAIHDLRALLKQAVHRFITTFSIDLLVVENALTIPMHISLGLALTEAIAETQIPTIAHHHDFHWERLRFSVNAVGDYLRMAFPPNLPNIRHVVINSEAQEQLALRAGIASTVIPNVLDFDHEPRIDANGSQAFRKAMGLKNGDRLILQPTRIIQRKGIEHAIALVRQLNDPRNKLVVSHEAGDEGMEYAQWLKEYACEHRVDLRLVTTRITDPWTGNGNGDCSLWDIYPYADFITYPSLYEGFGNAFLEAIYFRKPMLINRYATFIRDIEPLGFDLTVMDGFLSRKTVAAVQEILDTPQRRQKMVDHNYTVAAKHYSYKLLRSQLSTVLGRFFMDTEPLQAPAEETPTTRLPPCRTTVARFDNTPSCAVASG